jgi:hypothetical protein
MFRQFFASNDLVCVEKFVGSLERFMNCLPDDESPLHPGELTDQIPILTSYLSKSIPALAPKINEPRSTQLRPSYLFGGLLYIVRQESEPSDSRS